MTVSQQLEWLGARVRKLADLIQLATDDGDYDRICSGAKNRTSNCMSLALLLWRLGKDPSPVFVELVRGVESASLILEELDSSINPMSILPWVDAAYGASLTGLKIPPLNLEVLDNYVVADGFFGNVLMGHADIADWPQFRDAIPKNKRYDLARRTNEFYAGLLAGSVSAEDGVRLGEQLWAEREEDTFFDTGTGGCGDDNEMMVDYKLGAILKKIGSTVPTVHAWRW